MDAHKLISRCKAGEREALHLLYEQNRPRLLNICRQYTKADDVAEDLLHDAFVIILTSFNQLRDDDKLESWMATIVRNVGYHYKLHLEKERAALQQMGIDKQDVTEAGIMPDFEELQQLVVQLPEGYQQVFRLSVFEGLSHQEIGRLLGIAPHTSSSQLFHAKRMLKILIKQSWVLILLLIAIPTAIWTFLQKEETDVVKDLKPVSDNSNQQKPQLEPVIETPHDKPAYVSISKRPSTQPIRYQTEAVILPDSIPYVDEHVDTLTEITQVPKEDTLGDSLIFQYTPISAADDKPNLITKSPYKSSTWNIQLAYSGQTGQSDKYMAEASINQQSFASASNSFIPTNYSFSNWIDYSWSLNNAFPTDEVTAETRSLMEIAAQNSMINHGEMVAQYTHELPFNIQLTLSRSLTSRLYIETGLSYTQMKSVIMTGSTKAHILEQQRLSYLGIPLRFGWKWYNKAHLSLYNSAGVMLEFPIQGTLNVKHITNDITTFGKKSSLDVPCQWSMSLGLGIQYDLTPHLGIYMEPSLQYFYDEGSNLKSYRTEHPYSITLPLGLRFHW